MGQAEEDDDDAEGNESDDESNAETEKDDADDDDDEAHVCFSLQFIWISQLKHIQILFSYIFSICRMSYRKWGFKFLQQYGLEMCGWGGDTPKDFPFSPFLPLPFFFFFLFRKRYKNMQYMAMNSLPICSLFEKVIQKCSNLELHSL